jgi:hypothetical protein
MMSGHAFATIPNGHGIKEQVSKDLGTSFGGGRSLKTRPIIAPSYHVHQILYINSLSPLCLSVTRRSAAEPAASLQEPFPRSNCRR